MHVFVKSSSFPDKIHEIQKKKNISANKISALFSISVLFRFFFIYNMDTRDKKNEEFVILKSSKKNWHVKCLGEEGARQEHARREQASWHLQLTENIEHIQQYSS